MITISAIYRYPVKSMGENPLQTAIIDRFGIAQDRRWMLVDENNKFITQRQCAEMVKINVEPSGEGWRLKMDDQLSAPFSAHALSDQVCYVTVWRDQCAALVAPEAINQWLAERLRRACRLVYMPDSTQREVDPDYAKAGQTVSFADGFPLLLTAQESLADFNRRLSQPIEMLRFRPNLVIQGADAWSEDNWRVIQIGDLTFDVVKPCSRCAIPTINRETAVKEPEVFRALKQHRQRNGEVYFGQNLLPRGTGTLRVGDRVTVLK